MSLSSVVGLHAFFEGRARVHGEPELAGSLSEGFSGDQSGPLRVRPAGPRTRASAHSHPHTRSTVNVLFGTDRDAHHSYASLLRSSDVDTCQELSTLHRQNVPLRR